MLELIRLTSLPSHRSVHACQTAPPSAYGDRLGVGEADVDAGTVAEAWIKASRMPSSQMLMQMIWFTPPHCNAQDRKIRLDSSNTDRLPRMSVVGTGWRWFKHSSMHDYVWIVSHTSFSIRMRLLGEAVRRSCRIGHSSHQESELSQ